MRFKSLMLGGLALAACGASANVQDGGAASAGPTVQRSYEAAGFDAVSSAGPHKVVVSVGAGHSVRAEGPADTLDKMEVVVERGAVHIRPRREYRENNGWQDIRAATFYVSAPSLRAASLAGSGEMSVDRVDGDRFAGSVAGSGDLAIGALRVADADLSVAGSGDIVARGSANRARVSVAGAGNVRAAEVSTRTASVSVTGSGDVTLNASETAKVSVIGSGNVTVAGSAKCSVSKMGSGQARCGA